MNSRITSWVLAALAAGGCAPESGAESGAEEDEALGVAASAISVQEAIASSCSTMSVRGLSLQIIAQSNCIAPGAFVEIPPLANVTMSDTTFPFLEAPAKDAFVQAANDNPGMQLSINSMLRTVAQQLLLYRWYQNGQCNIGLAATPGNSNHETGLAFDTSDYNAWKSALTSHGFQWFGTADDVHFDYAGAGAVNYKGTDVLAFQQLWNKNHPDDAIDEDGAYGPQTEARLLAAPADGFANGPACVDPGTRPDVALSVGFDDARDAFADGPSAGVVDLFEADPSSWVVHLANTGGGDATEVTLAIDLDSESFDIVDYDVRVGPSPDGPFEPDPASSSSENPAHGSSLGAHAELHVGGILAGEEKLVTLTTLPLLYSVDKETVPQLRAWVSKIDDLYALASFGGDVTNDGSQTFNGGRLEAAQSVDVYSHTQWEWQSPRLEGASGAPGMTFTSSSTTLDVHGGSEGAAVAMPISNLAADGGATVTVRASRSGGTGPAKLLVARDSAELDDADVYPVSIADDGAPHEAAIEIDPGPIQRIALVPFAQTAGDASIDFIRIEGAEVIEGGGGSGGGGASDDDGPSDDDSCSCDAAGSPRGAAGLWMLALAGALVFRRKRR